MNTQKHVLIFGAGYLGQSLAQTLKSNDFQVALADVNKQKGIFYADITDKASLQLLKEDMPSPHIIVIAVSTKGGSSEAYKQTYLHGIENILEIFPEAQYIFCSSTAVYGITDGRWATESHTVSPLSSKAKILLQAEQLILKHQGLVVRLAAIYGPNRCELINKFVQKHQSISTNTNKWVNYIHRDDAATAITLLCHLEKSGKVINISDPNPLTLEEIYKYLQDLLEINKEVALPEQSSKNRGLTNQRISCNLLLSLGWEPLYPSFLDGVHNVLESLDENSEH